MDGALQLRQLVGAETTTAAAHLLDPAIVSAFRHSCALPISPDLKGWHRSRVFLLVGLSQKERGRGDRDKRMWAVGQLWVFLTHNTWVSPGQAVASLSTLLAG